jgi:endoglucanase
VGTAHRRTPERLLAACALLIALLLPSAPAHPSAGRQEASDRRLTPTTQFYIPAPHPAALEQIAGLAASGAEADARLIQDMLALPQAVWFTGGTPATVEREVRSIVEGATALGSVPLLVAYNVPGRDCAEYSAGGAATGDEYRAWIEGFAAGLGSERAVVILEPDGLAFTPADCGQPDTYDRLELISYAAHALLRAPKASIYLDGGNSGWQPVGEIAARLAEAGVQDVQGFFLNAANYRATEYELTFGTWVAQCIAFATNPEEGGWRLGRYEWCASQYYSPLGPVDPNDKRTWAYTDAWYAANMGSAVAVTTFVIDTSRNGQGPWMAPAEHPPGDPQEWCNPPQRGLGYRPTASTGQALVDAYLWIKPPGESDGLCHRWTDGPHDPVRGEAAPNAGEWFPEMVLELVRNANPPLRYSVHQPLL